MHRVNGFQKRQMVLGFIYLFILAFRYHFIYILFSFPLVFVSYHHFHFVIFSLLVLGYFVFFFVSIQVLRYQVTPHPHHGNTVTLAARLSVLAILTTPFLYFSSLPVVGGHFATPFFSLLDSP